MEIGDILGVLFIFGIFAVMIGASVRQVRNRVLLKKRAEFIQRYAFPPELRNRLQRNHELSLEGSGRVIEGLRQYFLACLAAQRKAIAKEVGMPSKAVDAAWHEFIVLTKAYADFCEKAFGRYLHHTPKAMMDTPTKDALANTLHQLRTPPVSPTAAYATIGAVPLLFALDRELGFKDGHMYDEAAIQDLEVHRQMQLASAGGASGSESGSGGTSGGDNSSPGGSDSGGGDGGGDGGGGGGCGGGS